MAILFIGSSFHQWFSNFHNSYNHIDGGYTTLHDKFPARQQRFQADVPEKSLSLSFSNPERKSFARTYLTTGSFLRDNSVMICFETFKLFTCTG